MGFEFKRCDVADVRAVDVALAQMWAWARDEVRRRGSSAAVLVSVDASAGVALFASGELAGVVVQAVCDAAGSEVESPPFEATN